MTKKIERDDLGTIAVVGCILAILFVSLAYGVSTGHTRKVDAVAPHVRAAARERGYDKIMVEEFRRRLDALPSS